MWFHSSGDRGHVGGLQGADSGRGEVAGDAAHTQAFLSVRRDGDLDHRIAEAHDPGERRADLGVRRQLDDALVLVGEGIRILF